MRRRRLRSARRAPWVDDAIATLVRILAVVVFLPLYWTCAREAHAHVGPPYPILVDEPAAGHLVSLWGDPDVGVGTFYVMIDAERSSHTQPDGEGLEVVLSVQPTSGRLPPVAYPAKRDERAPRLQYVAEVRFDRQEMWTIRLLPDSRRPDQQLVAEVEATPDALGQWSILIFLAPFVGVGGLWILALHRRAELERSQRAVR